MSDAQVATVTLDAADAPRRWEELVGKVAAGEARAVLERHGAPAVALIAARDLELLQFYEKKRAERFEVFDRLAAAFADVPGDELEREIDKAIAEVREEMRRERQGATAGGGRRGA